MKKYYYFAIMLFPQEKVVKDFVLYCTEKEMHEKSFQIVKGLDAASMSFNGKNANHHFGLMTKEVPSPEEMNKIFGKK